MSRRRRVLVVLGVLVLLAGAVLLVRAVVEKADRTRLETALRAAPAKALRAGFTDWSATRRVAHVPVTRDPGRIQQLVDAAYDRDLSAASGIGEAGVAMQRHLGFSPGTIDWELLAQARDGVAEVLRLDASVDPDDVRAALRASGYEAPKEDDGAWFASSDVLDQLDQMLGPEFQAVVVLADEHLVVTGETKEYAGLAADVARGDGASLADADDTDALTGSLTDPVVSAQVWSGDFACEDLSMADATKEDQARAEELVRQAGGVGPLSGLLMARPASRSLVVVERYEDADRARRDLKARAALAVGEAVGRGGDFTDDVTLTGSRTDGANVVLTMTAAEGNDYLLSSLNHGPILFATC